VSIVIKAKLAKSIPILKANKTNTRSNINFEDNSRVNSRFNSRVNSRIAVS
jgi:hypothetical protein